MSEKYESDKWVLDLASNYKNRKIREIKFQEYLDNRTPVWFSDHKRVDYNYLSVFTWNDTSLISSNADLFYSEEGYMINDNFPGIPFDGSLLGMNGIEHRRARSSISSVFSRSNILALEPMVREVTKMYFDNFVANKERSGDIYRDLCLQIPLEINRRMMDVRIEDKYPVLELTKHVIGNDDPDYGNGDPMIWMKSCRKLRRYSLRLANEKIESPGSDLTSMLLDKTSDSGFLSKEEFAQFFMLLVIAGMETTTHTLAHGIRLLTDNPEQRDILKDKFDETIDSACEEILRFEPPVLYFRRTATSDAEVSGIEVSKGDRVVMWYNCANKDPEKYSDPNKFLITREKAPPHMTFGGAGIHHCLGAQLARLEMKIFYEFFIEYFPKLNYDPNNIVYGKSRWGNGFKSFPVEW